MTFTTADLFDERGAELASVSLQFRNFGTRTAFSGPARTVRCFQDNALAKAVLATAGNGAVLVVDGGGSLETALMGDMIAQSAVDNGWSGVIINGAIRDSVVVDTLPLGVKALGTNPAKSGKEGTGEADVPVQLGATTVWPGAMVYADADGILVERGNPVA
ncbi:ribonuclease E activity regulator RraA [Arthrobacter sp. STN4]|uniref:ribonuclease E activity regulator RraA n=1 Tax=Arthrobacter sp. STN4 TaxID=2923276 RepID=UPI00211A0B9D|nr:ribonuclease E activity regulator RraA [Arthrobacter sp. STN4]MCQ9165247.1 ribonuclease E activity regulator RraA [Arthrobacter sp. STN4]